MTLYTYEDAAPLLSLSGRAAVHSRIKSLAETGAPLVVASESGDDQPVDLVPAGKRRFLLTEAGITKLKNFRRARGADRRPRKRRGKETQ